MRVFGELRRRNVFKVSIAYGLFSWLLIKVAHALTDLPGPDDDFIRIMTMVLVLAFPIVVLLAWAYEITPSGLKPTADVDKTQSITAETGRRLNYILLALLALAAATLIVDKFA